MYIIFFPACKTSQLVHTTGKDNSTATSCRHFWWRFRIHVLSVCEDFSIMTSSNGNIFHVTGHLCGEFTGPDEFPTQRPVTRNFDVYFDLRPNKRLSKQLWGWWFETQSRPLWCHRNENMYSNFIISWPWCGTGSWYTSSWKTTSR